MSSSARLAQLTAVTDAALGLAISRLAAVKLLVRFRHRSNDHHHGQQAQEFCRVHYADSQIETLDETMRPSEMSERVKEFLLALWYALIN